MGFTRKDAEQMERKYGVAYFVSTDGLTILPATHVSADANGAHHLGVVSIHPGILGDIINYRVVDANGRLLLHGDERNYAGTPAGRLRALRLAIQALRCCGCVNRVRPVANATRKA